MIRYRLAIIVLALMSLLYIVTPDFDFHRKRAFYESASSSTDDPSPSNDTVGKKVFEHQRNLSLRSENTSEYTTSKSLRETTTDQHQFSNRTRQLFTETSQPLSTTTIALTTSQPLNTTTLALTTSQPLNITTITSTTSQPLNTTTIALTTSQPLNTTTLAFTTSQPLNTTTIALTTSQPLITTTLALTTSQPLSMEATSTTTTTTTTTPTTTTPTTATTSTSTATTTTASTTPDPRPCYPTGVVYADWAGRIGNLLWEYIGVLVVSQRIGLTPYVHPHILHELDKVFVNLTIPALEMQFCGEYWSNDLHGNLFNVPNTTTIQILNYWSEAQSDLVRHIVEHKPDVRQALKFHRHLVAHAQEVLRAARRGADTVFVGVHVRRTDYKELLERRYNMTQANVSFYEHAMDMDRGKFKEVVFIVASDDIQWCEENLVGNYTDVVIERGTIEQDFVTMSSCNHTIIDYGTYGEWSSWLAGGETIVYDLLEVYDHSAYLGSLLNWTLIK